MYQLLKKELTLFSPINGRKIDLDKVPDKVFSSDFFRKSDEDLKMIGVSSIDSMFS